MLAGRSKFTNLCGEAEKKELHVFGLDPWAGASDGTNVISTNGMMLALPWRGASGRVAVLRHSHAGRLLADAPLIDVHTSPVADLTFSPHFPSVLATSSENGDIKVHRLNTDAAENSPIGSSDVISTLEGHSKRTCPLLFHPLVANTLISASLDQTVRVWDVERQAAVVNINSLAESVSGMALNSEGSLLSAATRDKLLNVVDLRAQTAVASTTAHDGTRAMTRTFWIDDNRIGTTGQSNLMKRQLRIWDVRQLDRPTVSYETDSGSGALMPIFDTDTQTLLLCARGECSIRSFDLSNGVTECATYQSPVAVIGVAALPKFSLEVMRHEIARLTVLSSEKSVFRISFTVPRKSIHFQDDIFVPTVSAEPSMALSEWLEGANQPPRRVSLRPEGVVAQSEVEVTPTASQQKGLIKDKERLFVDTEKEATQRLHDKMSKFSGPPPTSEVEGVAEEEWDD